MQESENFLRLLNKVGVKLEGALVPQACPYLCSERGARGEEGTRPWCTPPCCNLRAGALLPLASLILFSGRKGRGCSHKGVSPSGPPCVILSTCCGLSLVLQTNKGLRVSLKVEEPLLGPYRPGSNRLCPAQIAHSGWVPITENKKERPSPGEVADYTAGSQRSDPGGDPQRPPAVHWRNFCLLVEIMLVIKDSGPGQSQSSNFHGPQTLLYPTTTDINKQTFHWGNPWTTRSKRRGECDPWKRQCNRGEDAEGSGSEGLSSASKEIIIRISFKIISVVYAVSKMVYS